ncbi:MAG TPA: Na+/H+ antiporter NhaC family protein [Chryseolinea sp.]|nr:Na+/H+ antiporter NhaC family protein [Chryseolinea sp.]HPM31565.1 Na+/H+ antiporter NhaC family protein [Chryseolinea sp.]
MNLEKGKFAALLPLIVFLVVYLVTSIVLQDFYKMPVLVAFLIAVVVGFVQYPKSSFHDKVEVFSKGMGDSNIMLMCFIFLLAGAFAATSKSIGAVDSTVNFALSYLSPSLIIGGLFLIACFISLSLGTSVGTVVALSPIAVALNESVPGVLALALAAVVGGAMFGDNLSMISDTTIAATRTQNVEMRDKFKVNFFIALPPAIITFLIYTFSGAVSDFQIHDQTHEYSIIKIIPYIFVLTAALAGLNVIWVLLSGIVISAAIGFWGGNLNVWTSISSVNEGMTSMFELSITCIMIGGLVGLIRYQGGIDYILYQVSSLIKSKRGGELGIAGLTALVNFAIANNTITILIAGPLAKTIADKNGIDGKRSASILDTTSCFVQGILPYGAQLLAAVAIAKHQVTSFEIIGSLYYPFLLALATLIFIFLKKK